MTAAMRPNRFTLSGFIAATAISLTLAGTAEAGSRKNPAPIIYSGSKAKTAAAKRRAPARAAQPRATYKAAPVRRAAPQQAPTGKRLEFRYPDQPNVYYGANGSRPANAAQNPIAFKSAKAAVSPQAARQYAAAETPRYSAPRSTRDPMISQGGFDARAAAARNTAPVTPVQEVAMAAIQPERRAADYEAQGRAVEPVAQPGYDERGVASWYGDEFHGQPTANGEVFDQGALTAAHPTLPLPSLVQVTNLENNREIVLRVNDRGPFVQGRMIDVSKRAADELGFLTDGDAHVRVRYLGPAPILTAGQGAQNNVSVAPQPQPVETVLPLPRMDPIPNPAGGDFLVQVGSFSDIGNAQAFHASLSGLPVDIVPVFVNGADYFRVVVGPYASRDEAMAMRDQLDVQGIVDGRVILK